MQLTGTASKIKAAAAIIDGLVCQYDSPADSALLAAALIELGWPPRRARVTTGAKNAYLHTARHLSPGQRQQIDAGQARLSYFHNANNNGGRAGNGATAY